MLQPKQDYIIILKQQKKTKIHLPDGVKESTNMVPFEIVSIGPGIWQNGVFIKTTHKPGDMIFISGGVIEAKHEDVSIFFCREKDVVCELI